MLNVMSSASRALLTVVRFRLQRAAISHLCFANQNVIPGLSNNRFCKLDAVNFLVDRHLFSPPSVSTCLRDETDVSSCLQLTQVRRVNMC